MKSLFVLLILISCSTNKEPVKKEEEKPVVVVVPTKPEATAWYVPKPMTKIQILKDGQTPNQESEIVEIEAVPENDESCESGYAKIAKRIELIKKLGKKVLCYQSLSYEDWRCDAKEFPHASKGKRMTGWSENWPDWRVTSAAHKFWDSRYDQFKKIGCDLVEDDNEVDPNDNETGIPLTRNDSELASKYRSEQAHIRGMGHASKNNPSISDIKSKYSDMIMIEESGAFNERDSYLPWKKAGKFGVMIEYSSKGCKPYVGFNVQYHSNGDYFSDKYKDCN